MGSNLIVVVDFLTTTACGIVGHALKRCTDASDFEWSEEVEAIVSRARRVGPKGHLFFRLSREADRRCGINVQWKFDDYGSVIKMVWEPTGRVTAGATGYSSPNAEFIRSIYSLSECVYENLEIQEVAAYLDDMDEAWFRIAKSKPAIPLPELPLSPDP